MKTILIKEKNSIILLASSIVISILLHGCDLPRDNPLDPDAYNYGLCELPDTGTPVLSVTSFHSSQWFPSEDIISLEALVSGTASALADSVFLVYTDSLRYPMNRSGYEWRQSLESSDFFVLDLENLVGTAFRAVLYFEGNEEIYTNTSYLFRIIETVPETIQPDNITVTPLPEFTWEPVEEQFSISFLLTVYHISATSFVTEVGSIGSISSDSTSYSYTDSLETGYYYWTIAIADTFGNISRSKEASFSVIP